MVGINVTGMEMEAESKRLMRKSVMLRLFQRDFL